MLYQLSYTPDYLRNTAFLHCLCTFVHGAASRLVLLDTPAAFIRFDLVGLVGLEPTTPRLSSVCSNQLSYKPISFFQNLMSFTKYFSLQLIRVGAKFRAFFSRKEVIQPHLPIRLPCYDFTPVMNLTVVSALLAVRLPTSGKIHSHGVTGGVYKTRERIHRSMLICDY